MKNAFGSLVIVSENMYEAIKTKEEKAGHLGSFYDANFVGSQSCSVRKRLCHL